MYLFCVWNLVYAFTGNDEKDDIDFKEWNEMDQSKGAPRCCALDLVTPRPIENEAYNAYKFRPNHPLEKSGLAAIFLGPGSCDKKNRELFLSLPENKIVVGVFHTTPSRMKFLKDKVNYSQWEVNINNNTSKFGSQDEFIQEMGTIGDGKKMPFWCEGYNGVYKIHKKS